MSTRSHIIQRLEDGTVRYIYCHYDGYLEGVGTTLYNHYNDLEKINALFELGDLSSLGAEIGEKHNFNGLSENWCTSYKRDRGEKNTDFRIFPSLTDYIEYIKDDIGIEWCYLYNNGKWTYMENYGDTRYFIPFVKNSIKFEIKKKEDEENEDY